MQNGSVDINSILFYNLVPLNLGDQRDYPCRVGEIKIKL